MRKFYIQGVDVYTEVDEYGVEQFRQTIVCDVKTLVIFSCANVVGFVKSPSFARIVFQTFFGTAMFMAGFFYATL